MTFSFFNSFPLKLPVSFLNYMYNCVSVKFFSALGFPIQGSFAANKSVSLSEKKISFKVSVHFPYNFSIFFIISFTTANKTHASGICS